MREESWTLPYLQAIQVQNMGLPAYRAIVGGYGGVGRVLKWLRGWDGTRLLLLTLLLTLQIMLPAGDVMQARIPCIKAHS